MADQIHTTDILDRLHSAAEARMLPQGVSLMEIPKVWPGTLELEAAWEIRRLRARVKELEDGR